MILTENWQQSRSILNHFGRNPALFLAQVCHASFGINGFAARFPNFICGIVSLIMLYYLGRRICAALDCSGSSLTDRTCFLLLLLQVGIIDPWFNLFIFLGWRGS
jgi:hypothetical protein